MKMQKPTPAELAAMIPEITIVEMAFPAGDGIDDVYDKLTPIAREWVKTENRWGTGFFSMVFYGVDARRKKVDGHKPPEPDMHLEGVTEQDITRVLNWLRAAMGSYYPKHQDKEAVCGMLWQTFFLPPKELA
jgi:hypothetical protein